MQHKEGQASLLGLCPDRSSGREWAKRYTACWAGLSLVLLGRDPNEGNKRFSADCVRGQAERKKPRLGREADAR
jgi:hypothetical protein